MEFTKEQKRAIKQIIADYANDPDRCLFELKNYLVQLQNHFSDDYANLAYTIWQNYANKRSR
jgi:hypothetical protein